MSDAPGTEAEAATEAAEEAPPHEPGLAELSVLSVLKGGWNGISLEQLGPDGTQVIGMLVFHACPICFAVCPPPDEEHQWLQGHQNWHLSQARDWDFVSKFVSRVTNSGVLNEKPEDAGATDG